MRDLSAAGPFAVAVSDGEWHDGERGRTLKWRRFAAGRSGAPVVLFSHGLGGNRESAGRWLSHWAGWGIAGLIVQHPGTDADALGGASPLAMRHLLRRTADPTEVRRRQHDLRYALDRIAAETAAPLGLAGHSFGAASDQRLIGERRGHDDLPADPRIAAAVLFSPSARGGESPLGERFADVRIPTLHLTGTRDDGIGPGDIRAEDRCLPFRHQPGPEKWLLLLDGATHRDFSGDDRANPAPEHCRQLLSTSTAFWLGILGGEPTARQCVDMACQRP